MSRIFDTGEEFLEWLKDLDTSEADDKAPLSGANDR